MPSVDYLFEKVYAAVGSLCENEGSFEQRLYSAWFSLMRLTTDDAPDALREDLAFVLQQCKEHIIPKADAMTSFPEMERRQIGEKLVSLLIRSARLTARH